MELQAPLHAQEARELRKTLGRPELLRLKDMGMKEVQVLDVLGDRLLVRTVQPYTEMDRLEKEGLLVIPETAREKNAPLPSTGIVIQLGSKLTDPEDFESAGNFRADGTQIIEEGSLVMFGKYNGTDIGIGGADDFRILALTDILCTLTIPDAGIVPVKVRA